jgi:PKD repeat protein
MAITRIASTDTTYEVGNLSVFPENLDSKYQLYQATNNCQTTLKQSITYAGKYIVVDDNSAFPENGILRIGPAAGKSGPAEMVYYETKTAGVFRNLIRGFAGSRQNPWPVGSYVSNAVFSQHHNATKDAIIQIERDLGTSELPDENSLNGILKAQENRFLAPRPLFRAYPFKGAPPLKVRFQNFSTGPLIRYLWDFGDGTTSIEKSPSHIFQKEGIYTVQLNIITSLGAQGVITKTNYITVSEEEKAPFFYVSPNQGISVQTATALTNAGYPTDPTEFTYVDQTDGDIAQRYWIFDGPGKHDGVEVPTQSIAVYDPNIHTTSYVYDLPGSYQPSLLILFETQSLQRAFLSDTITVT